jgi:hypothetical protein
MHHEEAAQVYTDLVKIIYTSNKELFIYPILSQIPTSSNFPKEHQYILKPVSGTGKVCI